MNAIESHAVSICYDDIIIPNKWTNLKLTDIIFLFFFFCFHFVIMPKEQCEVYAYEYMGQLIK